MATATNKFQVQLPKPERVSEFTNYCYFEILEQLFDPTSRKTIQLKKELVASALNISVDILNDRYLNQTGGRFVLLGESIETEIVIPGPHYSKTRWVDIVDDHTKKLLGEYRYYRDELRKERRYIGSCLRNLLNIVEDELEVFIIFPEKIGHMLLNSPYHMNINRALANYNLNTNNINNSKYVTQLLKERLTEERITAIQQIVEQEQKGLHMINERFLDNLLTRV